ncbi:MAG TPA: S9 family peptidase [Thermoanaerobaculia bacterium]|nr:S9 family peptidase [Thermoanaerobaculia bacterium]
MRSIVVSCSLFVLLLSLPLAAAETQAPKPFQLDDLRLLVHLSDPQISPDGKEIAVLVSRPDWKTDKAKQEIDLVDVASGSLRKLTFDREELSSPRWSPNGETLAFIAKDAKSKKGQIYVMPMNGGDAVRITESKEGVDEFSWSPDGKSIAFMSEDPVPNKKALKHHEDAFRVTDNNYMTRAAVMPWHLWVVSAAGGKATRLTEGTWSLQTDQDTATPLAWSPDGKSVVFTRFPDPYFGNAYKSEIDRVEVPAKPERKSESGPEGKKKAAQAKLETTVETVVSAKGSGDLQYPPSASNTGDFAFMRARNGDLNNGNAVYVQRSGATLDATRDLARNINAYAWLPGGHGLLLRGDIGARSAFWEQPLNGPARRLKLGEVHPNGDPSVAASGAVAFIASTPGHPDELYVLDFLDSAPRRLTDLNAFVSERKLGKSEEVTWAGPGGFPEDGILTYPVDFIAGHKYPLVLVIHGGPEGASTLSFSPLTQLLAGKGFLVFQPNYRGSINLGDKYQHAIYRDTGEGPGKDVMAGLAAVEKMGMVDHARIGVTGWSYGGYMTSWLIGHYHVWKAAVSGAALTDWVMDYTIAFYQQGDLYFFGGSPWVKDYWNIWRDQSPIQYARAVTTPTLIMGDQGDPNVPIVNSYELYHALKDNGVTTEFYVYPVDKHFPHDIVHETDIYKRWIGWMEKYLR